MTSYTQESVFVGSCKSMSRVKIQFQLKRQLKWQGCVYKQTAGLCANISGRALFKHSDRVVCTHKCDVLGVDLMFNIIHMVPHR